MPNELIALFDELEKRLPTVTRGQLVDTVRVRLATTIAQVAVILALWPDLDDEEKLQNLDLVHGQLEAQIMMLKGKGLYPEAAPTGEAVTLAPALPVEAQAKALRQVLRQAQETPQEGPAP